MKVGEDTQEVSEKRSRLGTHKTREDSMVLLGSQFTQATKSRQPLVPTCASYASPMFSYLKRVGIVHLLPINKVHYLESTYSSRNVSK